MTHKFKKLAISLFAAIFFFACSDKYMGDYDYLNVDTEVSVTLNEETFVSLELATSVAEKFLGGEIAKKGNVKLLANASVETVMDKNNPSMYVVNYPEGGWVIVGATRNYYPVLAYSDEGNFELNTEIIGLNGWLKETQEAIRTSVAFDDKTKGQMRSLWAVYEKNDFKLPESSGAKNYQAMLDRIWELQNQYGSSGWNEFIALENAEWALGSSTYQSLMSLANAMNSPPEYTIVGIKESFNNPKVGPLLTSPAISWHQGYPYNQYVSNYPAGCGAVAMAQIMSFHKQPSNLTINGQTITWNNGSYLMTDSDAARLISGTGNAASMNYGSNGSWALPNNIRSGLQWYGYTVNQTSHNSSTLKNYILTNQKPVLMLGGVVNLPTVLTYINGHYWVCDGVSEYSSTVNFSIEFFNGWGYNSYISPSQPGNVLAPTYLYFYMNWGWGGTYNGWFGTSNVNTGNGNFQYQRQDYYISW